MTDKRSGQWLRNQSLSTSKTPTVEKKDEESYILLLVNSMYVLPFKQIVARARALMTFSKETGEQDSTRE